MAESAQFSNRKNMMYLYLVSLTILDVGQGVDLEDPIYLLEVCALAFQMLLFADPPS
jgi:hypothetical protein